MLNREARIEPWEPEGVVGRRRWRGRAGRLTKTPRAGGRGLRSQEPEGFVIRFVIRGEHLSEL